MDCKKCGSPSAVTLRRKDHYCSDCFLAATNHKFRACIGKNKILSKNEKVMLCLSGGEGSTVLLDLVYHGISLDIHKKLRITPYVLHIKETNNDEITESILAQCKKCNMDVYVTCLTSYFEECCQLPSPNCIQNRDTVIDAKLQTMLKTMPATASIDFVNKMKQSIYIKFAKLLDCNFIFTADTTTSLATNLLTSITIGRGSQIENDVGFIDTRDDTTKILRPMKDISKEELHEYIKLKKLFIIPQEISLSNSLQTLIGSFVTDLQENFPATISTVCKTADKLGAIDYKDTEKCSICKAALNNKSYKLTALEATNFSRIVSNGNLKNDKTITNSIDDTEDLKNDSNNENDTIFPYINKHLCYTCSRNYAYTRQYLPHDLKKLLEN